MEKMQSRVKGTLTFRASPHAHLEIEQTGGRHEISLKAAQTLTNRSPKLNGDYRPFERAKRWPPAFYLPQSP